MSNQSEHRMSTLIARLSLSKLGQGLRRITSAS